MISAPPALCAPGPGLGRKVSAPNGLCPGGGEVRKVSAPPRLVSNGSGFSTLPRVGEEWFDPAGVILTPLVQPQIIQREQINEIVDFCLQ